MTRVLVVWEDDYYDGLKSIVKRRMPALAPNPSAVPPTLAFHTSRGNTKFERYVSSTWTNVRRVGVPGAPGALDHLVCVVDGDKLRGFLPTVPVIPTANVQEKFDAWHAAASRAWEQKVGEWVAESVPRESVHGVVLRWSRESVLLAGYDRPPIREHLGLDVDHGAVRAFLLGTCKPPPSTFTDANAAMFTNAYRHPVGCLERMLNAQGLPMLAKNDVRTDDVLRGLARDHAAEVCARTPDLDALVRLLWKLAETQAAPPTAAPTPAAAKPTRARKKPRG